MYLTGFLYKENLSTIGASRNLVGIFEESEECWFNPNYCSTTVRFLSAPLTLSHSDCVL